MKEAAGEANMTVITIVLIGIVSLVATPLITNLMRTTEERSCCSNAGGVWRNNQCNQNDQGTFDQDTFDACVTGAD